MKKRDFLAGFCCGAFIARASGLDLSSVFQILIIALVVLVLSSLAKQNPPEGLYVTASDYTQISM